MDITNPMRTVIGKTRRGSKIVLVSTLINGRLSVMLETMFEDSDERYDAVSVLEAYIGFKLRRPHRNFWLWEELALCNFLFQAQWNVSVTDEASRLGHVDTFDRLKHGRSLLDVAFRR